MTIVIFISTIMQKVTAAHFKTHCLQLMDIAHVKHESVIITKRGKPIAKLIPYDETPPKLFGSLQGSATIKGDLIEPIDIEWEAN
ncbi:MAG: type II toxin-antitoxin system Phd/YefM family antitoxin [Gammaproteobacteria bacterium]